MSIEILKLINGDEIIGDIEGTGSKITITDPAKFQMFPTEEGGVAVAMVPWCQYSNEKTFSIDRSHIIMEAMPNDDIRNEYSNQFGTGIVTPPSDIIL